MVSGPLHSSPMGPGHWVACQAPERPHDYWCVYDERCYRCVIKAAAALANGQSDYGLFDMDNPEAPTMLLSEIAAGKGMDR